MPFHSRYFLVHNFLSVGPGLLGRSFSCRFRYLSLWIHQLDTFFTLYDLFGMLAEGIEYMEIYYVYLSKKRKHVNLIYYIEHAHEAGNDSWFLSFSVTRARNL